MSGKDYNVYQGADGVWRGKRQDATRASVTGNTQKAVFEQVREFAKKAGLKYLFTGLIITRSVKRIVTAMTPEKPKADILFSSATNRP